MYKQEGRTVFFALVIRPRRVACQDRPGLQGEVCLGSCLGGAQDCERGSGDYCAEQAGESPASCLMAKRRSFKGIHVVEILVS
ncbi:hypothetical protein D3C75_1099010 [compost metagenome]